MKVKGERTRNQKADFWRRQEGTVKKGKSMRTEIN